jgi:hypothetical protein
LAAGRYLLAEPSVAVALLPKLLSDARPAARAAGLDLAGQMPVGDVDLTRRTAALTADPATDVRLTAWTLLDQWVHGPASAAVVATLRDRPPAVAAAATDPDPHLRAVAHAVVAAAGLDRLPSAPTHDDANPSVLGTGRNPARTIGLTATVVLIVLVAVVILVVRQLLQTIPQTVPAVPQPDPAVPPQMVCNRCRGRVPSTSRFCRRCGLSFAAPERRSPNR